MRDILHVQSYQPSTTHEVKKNRVLLLSIWFVSFFFCPPFRFISSFLFPFSLFVLLFVISFQDKGYQAVDLVFQYVDAILFTCGTFVIDTFGTFGVGTCVNDAFGTCAVGTGVIDDFGTFAVGTGVIDAFGTFIDTLY